MHVHMYVCMLVCAETIHQWVKSHVRASEREGIFKMKDL